MNKRKFVDALGSGLINSLKVLAGVIAVNKVVGVTRSIYGLMTAITRLVRSLILQQIT